MSSLANLRAEDLMERDVLRLRTTDTAESAVEMLQEYGISGAPVVDAGGYLVGMLSLTDITRPEHVRGGRIEGARGDYDFGEPVEESSGEEAEDVIFSKEDYSPRVLGRELVKDWMTPRIVAVGPRATLRDICRLMVAESIHRVIVAEGNSLLGIISTSAIVKALAERL